MDKMDQKKELPDTNTENSKHVPSQKESPSKQQQKQQQAHGKQKVQEKPQDKEDKKHEDKPLSPENSKAHEVDFNDILAVFYASEEISEENLAHIKHKISEDCSKEILKEFKMTLSKSIDTDEKQFTLQKLKQWITLNKKQKQKDNENQMAKQKEKERQKQKKEKEQQKENEIWKSKTQSQHISEPKREVQRKKSQKITHQEQEKTKSEGAKIEQKLKVNSIDSSEDRFLKLLTKYFKRSDKQLHKCSPNFSLEMSYNISSPQENILDFDIKILIGQKQITQIQTQFESKKIITQKEGKEYLVFQIETKKGEVIEELLEQSLKQKKISVEGFEFKTNTDEKHLYIGLGYENDNSNSRLRKIYSIFEGNQTQQNCKIEMHGKFGLGHEGKTKPEDRKFIKCISKGFEFKFNVTGSPSINQRFRKNIETENRQSVLYSLLAITKNSQLKLKLKKMEDVNIIFNKLGILEAVKTTPTIKQVLNDYLHELFQSGTPNILEISSFLSLILKEAESPKISVIKFNQNTLISASLSQQKNIGGIIHR